MFKIELTPEALEDMRLYRKHEKKRIFDEIEKQLKHQPAQETRNRKKLHPNELAEWELRVDKFRIFYDIDECNKLVKIETVGYKQGSKLFIHGEEYEL
jgi:mRNA-degrading endonuclease RelE of RelBE toxin-antitoxin system